MDYREFHDPESWIEASAHILIESVYRAWRLDTLPLLCLAGGQTPEPVYRCFAQQLIADFAVETAMGSTSKQNTIVIVPGDERCYPEQPQLLNETLLKATLSRAIPPIAVQSWFPHAESPGSRQDPSVLCAHMDATLARLGAERSKRFDCTVLGLGADGHTAGIFKKTFDAKASAAYLAPDFPSNRVSLLPETLGDSETTLVLVKKQGKETAIEAMLRGGALINSCMSHNTHVYCLV